MIWNMKDSKDYLNYYKKELAIWNLLNYKIIISIENFMHDQANEGDDIFSITSSICSCLVRLWSLHFFVK